MDDLNKYFDPNESILTFRAPNFCAKFHQNRTKIATVGVRTDRQTDRQTDRRTQVVLLRATAYMLSAHMLSQFRPSVRLSVCLSVRLSVTRVIHAKTVVVRIVQFSPHSSPIPLVFVR